MPPNPTGPTNPELRMLIRFLRKAAHEYNARIWAYVADLLERPRRQRVEVNVGKINRLCNDGDVVVVPGKVLGGGAITKRVIVAAWAFSKKAKELIERAGGKAISIPELVRANNRGSGVKIII